MHPSLRRVVLVALFALVAVAGCSHAQVHRAGVDWIEVRSTNIVLRTDLPDDVAMRIVEEMQRTHDAFASKVLRCAFDGQQPLVQDVAIVGSDTDYVRMFGVDTGGIFFPGDRWSDGASRLVVRNRRGDWSRQTFHHELGHALVDRCFPSAPTWLNEGLASFLETATLEDDLLTLGRPAYVLTSGARGTHGLWTDDGMIVALPRSEFVLPSSILAFGPERFYAQGSWSDDGSAVEARYATAWAMVHAFTLGAESPVRTRFAGYLGDLKVGRDATIAFEERFQGIDVDRLVTDYFDRREIPVVELPLDAAPEDVATVVVPMSRGDAHLEIARLFSTGRESSGAQLAREHIEVALGVPVTRARAIVALAELDEDDEKPEVALDRVGRGLAESPSDRDLLRSYVLLLLSREGPTEAPAVPTLEEAVSRLAAVATAAVDRVALAAGYLALGDFERANANATTAIEATPLSVRAHVILAQVHAASGRFDEAARVVARAIRLAGHDADLLRRLVALRERIEAARARTD